MNAASAPAAATSAPVASVVVSAHKPAAAAAAASNERLILTRMVLENFKSWGGVKEIGPFHKNFSAVVGANGSGKSNIIDALLFVFGKRAKQLRHNKVSELIHVSDQFPDLDHARVSVHFVLIRDSAQISAAGNALEDAADVVSGSELVITRTATRSNQSKYLLNDRTSSWTEITDLLKRHGVDLDHNRFLILQGEVEQISLMKPKAATPHDTGLLEYLEDIIGSHVYVERIEAAAKQVEERNEERATFLTRVRAVEKEVQGLEGARVEAEEYLACERRLADRRAVLLQRDRLHSDRQLQRTEPARAALAQQLADAKARAPALAAALDESEQRYRTLVESHDALQRELARARECFAQFERRDVQLHEDLKHLKRKEKRLADAMLAEQTRLDDATAVLARVQAELSALQSTEVDAQKQHSVAEQRLEAALAQLRGPQLAPLQAQLEQATRDQLPFEKRITDASSAIQVTDAELVLLRERQSSASTALAEAEQTVQQLESQRTARATELTAAREAVQRSETALQQLTTQRQQMAASDADANTRARQLRQRVAASRQAAATRVAHNSVLAALLDAKRRGQLDGIHGRLGDLGHIDARYDVAVSTAASSALDHVVVQSAEHAQRAVQLLRQRSLGTATFLILDKQQQALAADVQRPFTVPQLENASVQPRRLFDLVQPKRDEYAVAFYYALRDTLVCESLDHATQLAFNNSNNKRVRVVTLDGKLIDASGTMSGGGQRPIRGLLQLSNVTVQEKRGGKKKDIPAAAVETDEEMTDAELARLESEARELDQTVRRLREQLDTVSADEERLGAQLSTDRLRADTLAVELPALEAQLGQWRDHRLPQLRERVRQAQAGGPDQRRIDALTAQRQQQAAALDEARAAARSGSERVAGLQRQVEAAGGAEVRTAREAVTAAAALLDQLASQRTRAEVQAATAEKNVKKATDARQTHQTAFDEVMLQHKRLRDELEQLTADADALLQSQQSTQALVDEKAAALRNVTADHERLKQAAAEQKRAEVELSNRLDTETRAERDLRAQLATLERKLRELQRHKRRMNPDRDDNVANNNGGGEEESAPETDQQVAVAVAASVAADDPDALPVLDEAALDAVDANAVGEEIAVLEAQRAAARPNMGAIREYRRKTAELTQRTAELDRCTEQRDAARRVHDDLRKQRLHEFMAGFSAISLKLKEMYQMITLGGDAELELVDSLDPFSEGIVFSVRPPRKNWKNIQNLSGGEKTLSSLALVFALHHYKPTPLYVMDEIDAALDFKNVSIVANYIKERTRNAQFVIISLRNNMFEMSDRMVGVYKTHNVSKSVTINPHAFSIPVM